MSDPQERPGLDPVIAGAARGWFYAGVFLLCMSVLMLQVIQTRILSVVTSYYLVFFSISMAMFGLTAGALIVYVRSEATRARLSHELTWTSTAYAVGLFVCFLTQLSSVVVTPPTAMAIVIWLKLIVVLATPFVFAGMAVSTALTRSPWPVGIVYGVDLAGAAAGCLVVIGLLDVVDAISSVFVVAGIAALAGGCFARARLGVAPARWSPLARTLVRPGWVAAALLVLAAANSLTPYGIRLVMIKGAIERRQAAELEAWNSFSRIVASGSRLQRPVLWGPSPAVPGDVRAEQRLLTIDGFAGTIMVRFGGDPRSVEFLRYDVTNLAYFIRDRGRAAVIGVGSGRDVLAAHLFGFRDIVGVELNPIFIRWLTDPAMLREYAGVAGLPGVRFEVDEGRTWFARTRERFDLIQMSMIDTFAATSSGALTLSENGLYTVEAWKLFLSTLTPGGVFTVSRWYSDESFVEVGRVVSLALAALLAGGAERPADHLYLAATDQLVTLILSREPLASADVARLDEVAARYRYQVLIRPGTSPTAPIFRDLLSAVSLADLNARAQRYLLDVSPPTDARPFFFNQLRISRPGDVVTLLSEAGRWVVPAGNIQAAVTLLMIIVLSAVLVLLVIVLPARVSVHAVDRQLVRWGTLYFLLIGVGFMFVEIGLIQRISIFMGHPTHALGIVLFSIILSTGIGSFLSERLAPSRGAHFTTWLVLLGAYLWSLPAWLPATIHTFQSGSLVVRALVSAVVVTPAGVLMGFGFPTGMRLVTRTDPRPTPWFWGINQKFPHFPSRIVHGVMEIGHRRPAGYCLHRYRFQ